MTGANHSSELQGGFSDGVTNRTPLAIAHANPSGDDDQRTRCLRNTAPTSGPDQGCGHLPYDWNPT